VTFFVVAKTNNIHFAESIQFSHVGLPSWYCWEKATTTFLLTRISTDVLNCHCRNN